MATEAPPTSPTPVKEESFRGPSMEPPRLAAANNFFIIGSDDRPHDVRTVAVSISCRVNIKVADREFSTAIPLHEALILRTYYDYMAGGCTLSFNGYWPPGVDRYRRLTQDLLKAEVSRLSARVVPRKDSTPLDCFAMYFPGTMNERLVRMHKVMVEMYEAWEKLVITATSRIPILEKPDRPELLYSMACNYITEQEIETIIRLADPAGAALSELILPEVKISPASAISPQIQNLEDIIAQAHALVDNAPASKTEAAFERLTTAGFDASTAEKVSSLLEKYDSGDKIPEDALVSAAGGKTKAASAKLALRV